MSPEWTAIVAVQLPQRTVRCEPAWRTSTHPRWRRILRRFRAVTTGSLFALDTICLWRIAATVEQGLPCTRRARGSERDPLRACRERSPIRRSETPATGSGPLAGGCNALSDACPRDRIIRLSEHEPRSGDRAGSQCRSGGGSARSPAGLGGRPDKCSATLDDDEGRSLSPVVSDCSVSVWGDAARTSRCSSSTSSITPGCASSSIMSDSSAPGRARMSSSSLRWVAACSLPCVCWMAKTITSVTADAETSKAATQPLGKPITAPAAIRPIMAEMMAIAMAGKDV